MRIVTPAVVATGLALSACTTPEPATTPVPEAVVALAAPHQDVASARLRPEDGCYWYMHAGPVETTPLPLRTAEGRRICTGATETPGT